MLQYQDDRRGEFTPQVQKATRERLVLRYRKARCSSVPSWATGRGARLGADWPGQGKNGHKNGHKQTELQGKTFFESVKRGGKKDFQRAPWGRRLALNGRDEEGKDSLGAPEGWRSLTMTAGQCHKRNRLSTREGRKVENFFSVTDGHVVSMLGRACLASPLRLPLATMRTRFGPAPQGREFQSWRSAENTNK